MEKTESTGRSSAEGCMNIDLMRSLVKQYSELVRNLKYHRGLLTSEKVTLYVVSWYECICRKLLDCNVINGPFP